MIHFIDFEVFEYNWLAVIIDPAREKIHKIWDNPGALAKYYEDFKHEIFCGYNIAHYDQYIFQSILCGFNPKEVNDYIIVKDKPGYYFSPLLKNYPLIVYDAMVRNRGLKQLEGFMGNKIKESDVPFDIKRPLTDAEKVEVEEYCIHDVDQLMEVFAETQKNFEAHMMLIKTFGMPLHYLSKTQAQLSAMILGCNFQSRDDEWDIEIIDTLRISKYNDVVKWFTDPANHRYDAEYSRQVAGVDHIFAWGGLHGARPSYHSKGLIIHVDVNSFYPAIMIEYDLLSRNVRDKSKYREIRDLRIKYKNEGNPLQAPYKIVLNATYGICKDKHSSAFDPRQANRICVNGQLLLLDLIEHLEVIPGFELIQSNTDGLIIKIPDTDEAFAAVDDICYEWETRTRMGLGFDYVEAIWQKDVNNYLFKYSHGKKAGKLERKGAYVKELSPLDNDLPIINKALVNYMVYGTPIDITINTCNDLKDFQMVKKISGKYNYITHGSEFAKVRNQAGGYDTKCIKQGEILSEKCIRCFASNRSRDGALHKLHATTGRWAKLENTPEHAFIWNDDVNGVICPNYLDKTWYINKAKERLEGFGVV